MANLSREMLRVVMKHLSDLGAKKGGIARAKSLTPERRSEIARKAGSAPKRPRKPTNGR